MRQTVFIADLHLSDDTPKLNSLFLNALQDWRGETDALYILGDLFEVWLGDDLACGAAQTASAALKAFSADVPVYFICGNRDFLLGPRYARQSGIILLPQTVLVELYGRKYLISHGDEMCTDDLPYQRFRRIIRTPWIEKALLRQPPCIRRALAARMREASKKRKRAVGRSTLSDVTEKGVQAALRHYPQADALIHGHTHRPAVHEHRFDGRTIQRYVLPDWYDGFGGYLSVSPEGCELKPLGRAADGGAGF
ncbi:MAG: UDP-2,3-diacylglucosamine diphosphatase [Neisseria sp.]|nr:UDP-2,3-diacylglucosamine diphosphatase [Neisseria sp.]